MNSKLRALIISGIIVVTSAGVLSGCTRDHLEDIAVDVETQMEASRKDDNTTDGSGQGIELEVYLEKKDDLYKLFNKVKMDFAGLDTREAFAEALSAIDDERIDYAYLAFEDDSFIISPEVELPEDYSPTDRPWYIEAMKAGRFHDEYMDAMKDWMYYTVAEPVGNDKIGQVVLGIDFVLEDDVEKAEAYFNYIYEISEEENDELDSFFSDPVVFLSDEDVKSWHVVMQQLDQDMAPYTDGEDIESVLKSLCARNKDVYAAYVATPDGRLYYTDEVELPPDYDPTKRPWYSSTLSQESVYISEPFKDFSTGNTINALFIELESAPEEGWVLGVDIIEGNE